MNSRHQRVDELRRVLRRRAVGDVDALRRERAADVLEVAEPLLADRRAGRPATPVALELGDLRARLLDQVRVEAAGEAAVARQHAPARRGAAVAG